MLRLHTFGGLSLTVGAGRRPISGAGGQRRPLALLAFLAAANGRGRRRDVILGHFWPEKDDERARAVLAQTLYALRRDTGARELVVGAEELRVNPELLSSDLADFRAALAAGEHRRAVELYAGPFLEGVYLAGVPEFERWVSLERERLARDVAQALEQLAESAKARGDVAEAARWWRRSVELDPLAARAVVGLVEALGASGDVPGALQAAQAHADRLAAELELPPDAEVLAAVERVRASALVRATPPEAPAPTPRPAAPARADAPAGGELVVGTEPADARLKSGGGPRAEPPSARSAARAAARTSTAIRALQRHARRRGFVVGFAVALVAAAAMLGLALARRDRAPAPTAVAAIGDIREFGVPDSAVAAPAVREMLATSLSRIAGYEVISGARMAEVEASLRAGGTGARGAPTAQQVARAAGAGEVLEGTLLRDGAGYRLDLRRVDLATGIIRRAYSLRGTDLAALVDDGTARIAADLGAPAPADGVAAFASRSRVAYRFYEEGLRAFYDGDMDGAHRLFDAALAEDSTFAMAAYQAYRATVSRDGMLGRAYLQRAHRLAGRLPDRDALLVRAAWLDDANDARGSAVAETLAVRYPTEPEGQLRLGGQLLRAGDFAGALRRFRRVVELDSASLRTDRADCKACDALLGLGRTYAAMDSLAAAERIARRMVQLRPTSSPAWDLLVSTLAFQGRFDEATAAFRRLLDVRADGGDPQDFAARRWLHEGIPCRTELLLREVVRGDTSRKADDARWWVGHALREQGRPVAALRPLGVLRAHAVAGGQRGFGERLHYGQALLEAGRAREAAAEFLGASAGPVDPRSPAGLEARMRAWALVHRADALAALGDTAALRPLVDTLRVVGARSALGRDHLLHEHARGLLLRVQGRRDDAIAAFGRAVGSPTQGFTRSQWEGARLLVAAGRPAEAVAMAAPALRGPVDASNMYVLRTELHEVLADAWRALGRADSAAVHDAHVAAAWRDAEPPYAARAGTARVRALAHPAGAATLARLASGPSCTATGVR